MCLTHLACLFNRGLLHPVPADSIRPESGDAGSNVDIVEFRPWNSGIGRRSRKTLCRDWCGCGGQGSSTRPLFTVMLELPGVKPTKGGLLWGCQTGRCLSSAEYTYVNPAGWEPCCVLVCITPSSRTCGMLADTLFAIISSIFRGLGGLDSLI